ncbi:MAG: hypothetical protein K0Q79_1896 [Flavipsychrobacter sp.]|jgi:hypothetical protein|nr:hypothetical protein [Flavipsychrobacter sp.]
MDKNLVNIDDLVRQRLLGGEEKERAGAWTRMSELLEEEMPRRRGAFMWRRTYSALGILLLVGAISLGGYELNKFRGLGNASDNTVAATAPAVNGNNNAVAYNNTTTDNTTANTEHNTTTNNNTDNKTTNNEPNKTNSSQSNKLIAANEVKNTKDQKLQNPSRKTEDGNNKLTNNTANSSVLASNTTGVNSKNQKVQNTNKVAEATSNEVVTNNTVANNNKPVKNGNPAANTDVHEVNNDASTTGISNKVAETETTNKPVVKTNNTVAKTEPGIKTERRNRAESGNVNAERSKSAETGNNTTSVAKKTENTERANRARSGNVNPERRKSAESGNTASVAKKTENTERSKHADNEELVKKTEQGNSIESDALVSTKTTKTTPAPKTEEKAVVKTERRNSAKIGNVNPERRKSAESGNVNPERRKNAESSNNLEVLSSSVATSKPVVTKTSKVAAKETAPAKPAKIAAIPGNTKAKPVAPATSGTKTTSTSTTSIATANKTPVASGTKNKRGPVGFSNKIPAPSKADKGGASEMKDISLVNSRKHKRVIEKLVVMQRYLKTANREENRKLDTISIESITEEYEVASAERAEAAKNGNSVAVSEDPDMDSSPIKPGASSESFSMSAKEANNKQPVGAKTLENLNAAFNDIKYNAGHATFAMGISGGINRTFFGPNNFMGFQFGMSSMLSFGQSLSLMAELKYFNRINNNYNLNDDFYQYTAQPNGTFKREQVSNPYRIATLQSIELPIAVRYTTGRFNFAVGPNVVYTFNVNAGNYRTVDPNNTATYVSAIGNDNTAQLKADDFNSRFGLGYLFGVSYQISPKVTIDLRDVQTIWDNAKTDGAKAVSTQLFRSPSFQLSLGYRFGGGNKEK